MEMAKDKSCALNRIKLTEVQIRYWDPEIEPSRYSFVDYAIKEGYSIFFYDRLGVGKSQK